MATPRKPTKPKAPPKRAAMLPATEVQPGAVGAVLSTLQSHGVMTVGSEQVLSEAEKQEQAEKRHKFLSLARARFKMSANAESLMRRDMLEDLQFYASDQWPQQTKMERTLDGRPCLTINRLPQFVRQVVNQARQSRPAIQYNPVDDGADPETAEVLQGIARMIERNSRAHIAYSTANEHQAIMGRGYWRVIAEYARDDGMDQEIRIKRVMDQFTVYPDPACTEPDYSDATFCFIIERVPTAAYKVRYGEEAAVSLHEFASIGDAAPDWCYGEGVQVAEYYYIDERRATLQEVLTETTVNGETTRVRITVEKGSIPAEHLQPRPDGLGGVREPRTIVLKERPTIKRQVKWALINGAQILEGNKDLTEGRDIPGSYIPVIPVLGEELIVDGRRTLRGMVRDAKDPQRAYNFWVSAETEMIALAPRAPVIGAVGQFESQAGKWNTANRRNYSYLEYDPIDVNGTLVPPPMRASFDPNVGPIIEATMQADRDLKSVIGMFDASQERSQEQSGKAILARQRQGEEGTSHFLDNLSRSIEHTGRILLEWIPVYYDRPRMLRILGLDDEPKDVIVHRGNAEAAQAMADPVRDSIMQGRPFDLGVGRYDVTVSQGPSFQSRRQEAVESMIQLIQAYPAVLPVIGDVLVKNMDWPGARQIAARLKRMIPPEARDPEEGAAEVPPEVQQQMQQMSQQLEAAMSALAEKDQIIQTKAQELAAKGEIARMEMESKERIESFKAISAIREIEAQARADAALEMLKAKLEEITRRMDRAHEERMADKQAFLPPSSGSGKSSGAAGAR
jgi:hypothetical protein